jgi:S-formylglutathione hydrolase FrmB
MADNTFDDNEETVVSPRTLGTTAADSEDDLEATTVVERNTTIGAVSSDDDAEETVIVTRGPAPHVDADHDVDETVVVTGRTISDDAEETVVVHRPSGDSVDETVIVDRTQTIETTEDTIIVDRTDDSDETVIVGRASATTAKRESSLRVLPRRGASRQITRAPGGALAERSGVVASGPAVIDTYAPRQLPPPPLGSMSSTFSAHEQRQHAAGMPSVARHSRRVGRIAIAVFAGSFVISAVGLIAIVVVLIRG